MKKYYKNDLFFLFCTSLFFFIFFNYLDNQPLIISSDVKLYYLPFIEDFNNVYNLFSDDTLGGHLKIFERPPLFLIFLYLINLLSNVTQVNFHLLFLIVSFICLLITNVYSYKIAKLIFQNNNFEYLVILVISANIYNLYLFNHLNTESLYITFIIPGLYYLLNVKKYQKQFVLAAIFLSLATLTRPAGASILISLILSYFFFYKLFKKQNFNLIKFIFIYISPIILWSIIILIFTGEYYFLGTLSSNYSALSLTYIIELQNINLESYSDEILNLITKFQNTYTDKSILNTFKYISYNFTENYYAFFEIFIDKAKRILYGTHSGKFIIELTIVNSIIYSVYLINIIYFFIKFNKLSDKVKIFFSTSLFIFLTQYLQVILFTPLIRYIIPIMNLILISNFLIFNKKS